MTRKKKETSSKMSFRTTVFIILAGIAAINFRFGSMILNKLSAIESFGVVPRKENVTTKVCLMALSRNEAYRMPKMLESIRGQVTGYMVCDTGSVDNTKEIIKSFFDSQGITGQIVSHEWENFAQNRNMCFKEGSKRMRNECDYWLILESDHVFVSEHGVRLPDLNLTSECYRLEERNGKTVYNTPRLVSAKLDWKYVGAVHEYLALENDHPYGHRNLPSGIYAHHNIEFSLKKYEKYREILEAEVVRQPEDSRTRYYLGQTYKILDEKDKAIQQWVKRVELGGWKEEAYMAAYDASMVLKDIYEANGNITMDTYESLKRWIGIESLKPGITDVITAFKNATSILPYRKEAWYQLAELHNRKENKDPKTCLEYALEGISKPNYNSGTLFGDLNIANYYLDDTVCVCGYYAQAYEEGENGCLRLISKLESLGELDSSQQSTLDRTKENLKFYPVHQDKKVWFDTIGDLSKTSRGSARPVKIAFHSYQLGPRGTEVAIFDYGMWLELFYNVESHFVFPYPGWRPLDESALIKFNTTFPGRVHFVHEDIYRPILYRYKLDNLLRKIRANILYRIELDYGNYQVSHVVPTLVHEVFNCSVAKGTKHLAISPFVQSSLGDHCTGSVPHTVWLPDCNEENLRENIGIPEDAFVFGWYGGQDAWDPSATDIVRKIANKYPDNGSTTSKKVYFLFQNFPIQEYDRLKDLKNIVLVPTTSSLNQKCRFIQTCDAFLHTRLLGESFGLAVAEFAIKNKPIITNANGIHRFHLSILGDHARAYSSYEELEQIMENMINRGETKQGSADKDCKQPGLPDVYSPYSPCKVMQQFNQEFFEGKLVPRDNGTVMKRFCEGKTQLINPKDLADYGIELF